MCVVMIFISHRGNLHGKTKERENDPFYISEALDMGFDVEVDVRRVEEKWFLGHDEPEYRVDKLFLENKRIWCHAKDIHTLECLLHIDCHCFWHQTDDVTLTSKNYIWTYPTKQLSPSSIAVMPEVANYKIVELKKCSGICSDNIIEFRKKING